MRGGQWHHLRPHKRGCLPRLRPAPLFVHGWHRVGGTDPHRVACLRFIGRCKYRKSDFLLTAPPDNPTKWCLLRSSSRTLLRQQEMLMIQVILFDTLSAVSGEYELSGWVWNVHEYVVVLKQNVAIRTQCTFIGLGIPQNTKAQIDKWHSRTKFVLRTARFPYNVLTHIPKVISAPAPLRYYTIKLFIKT